MKPFPEKKERIIKDSCTLKFKFINSPSSRGQRNAHAHPPWCRDTELLCPWGFSGDCALCCSKARLAWASLSSSEPLFFHLPPQQSVRGLQIDPRGGRRAVFLSRN